MQQITRSELIPILEILKSKMILFEILIPKFCTIKSTINELNYIIIPKTNIIIFQEENNEEEDILTLCLESEFYYFGEWDEDIIDVTIIIKQQDKEIRIKCEY